MKRINIILTVAVLAIFLAAGGILLQKGQAPAATVQTIAAPSQTEAFVPEWAKPAEAVVVDFGENLAASASFTATGFTQTYKPTFANDQSVMTYWEGRDFDSLLMAELPEASVVGHLVIRLNPSALWAARKQTIAVQASADGETFVPLIEAQEYAFDPVAANTVLLTVPAELADTPYRFVRLAFTANTGAGAGQAAEVEIYPE